MRSARLPGDIRLELRFRRGTPGRIRTRDPLLRRHLRRVAGGRPMSLITAFTCSDSSWTSPGVLWSLSLLAPCLAPETG